MLVLASPRSTGGSISRSTRSTTPQVLVLSAEVTGSGSDNGSDSGSGAVSGSGSDSHALTGGSGSGTVARLLLVVVFAEV